MLVVYYDDKVHYHRLALPLQQVDLQEDPHIIRKILWFYANKIDSHHICSLNYRFGFVKLFILLL